MVASRSASPAAASINSVCSIAFEGSHNAVPRVARISKMARGLAGDRRADADGVGVYRDPQRGDECVALPQARCYRAAPLPHLRCYR